MKNGFSSIAKVCILVLFLVSLCFVCSCKKSPEGPAPDASTKKPDEVKTPEAKVDVNEPVKIDANEVTAKTPDETKTPEETTTPEASVEVPAGWVPIEIGLPKPMFVGTPQDTRVANLRPPLGKSRPQFFAPAGTKNVAAGKPVSSSDEEPIIGEIDMITDGDKEAADGSYVELGPFQQDVTIDLEGMYNIYAIVVWHYHKQARVYFDVVVQVADDPDFITNVVTLFNNDTDNSLGLGVGKDMHYTETNEGELIDAKGVKARYVRLYSKGNTSNDLNHYIEVEVYGKPVE